MIILEIEDNWYWFLVFSAGIALIAAVVLFFESRRESDDILRINPRIVVRNIFLNQIAFYLLYLWTAFSVDIIAGEQFLWGGQVFTFRLCSFYTRRGLFAGLSLIVALASTSIVLTATVQTYRHMLDYCFTLWVNHFIVVSIATGEFPVNGAWWVASGAGLIASMIFSERLCYRLETMSYQSALHSSLKAKKSKKEETELPELDDAEPFASHTSFTESSISTTDESTQNSLRKKRKEESSEDESSHSNHKGAKKNSKQDSSTSTGEEEGSTSEEEEGSSEDTSCAELAQHDSLRSDEVPVGEQGTRKSEKRKSKKEVGKKQSGSSNKSKKSKSEDESKPKSQKLKEEIPSSSPKRHRKKSKRDYSDETSEENEIELQETDTPTPKESDESD